VTTPTRTEEAPRRRASDTRHEGGSRYAALTDEDLLAEQGRTGPRPLRVPRAARAAAHTGWATARERWAGLTATLGREEAGPRRGARAATDIACLLVGLALALTPLLPVYGGATAIPALVGGLAVGTGVAAVGAWRRWSGLGVVAALVVGYVLVGGPLAAPGTALGRILPGAQTPVALARGAASSWKQVLTLQPPIGPAGTVLVAPLLLALAGSAAAVTLALRARSAPVAAVAVVVPLMVALVSALLGTATPPLDPALEGTAVAVLLGAWVCWRAGRLRAQRVLATGVVAAVAIGAGLAGGPVATDDASRFVLRERITPPWDPDDYPSPLAAFRQYVKQNDTVLFTVSGLPEGARIRLATFDRYDGVVWNVAGSGTAEASGEFRRVGTDLAARIAGASATVRVNVGALDGPWLPTVGEATTIALGPSEQPSLRFNDATGAAVVVDGLHQGLSYTIDAVVPAVPSVKTLGAAPAQQVSQPALTGEPARIRTLAADIARQAGKPAEVVQALATWLTDNGYFSNGQSGEHPSLSGHGADRLANFLGGDVMVGDGEQYAATLALMVREMGLPARVVLGFVPGSGEGSAGPKTTADGAVEVTGADVQAWVEVPFVGYGWVPFDATPPTSKTVNEDPNPAPSEPKPQVVQPPPPPEPAVKAPDDDTARPSTRQDDQRSGATPTWVRVLAYSGAGAGGLVVLAGPLLTVLALKLGRRRRRRRALDPVRRVAGGWDEVMDAARDLRRPPSRGTRREAAAAVGLAFADAHDEPSGVVAVRLDGLARRADRAVFADGVPSDADVAAYWLDVDDAVAAMRSAVPARTRLWARGSIRSLRGRVAGPRRRRGMVPLVRRTLLLARRGGAL
jgi:transglutaminase-like putative cysteine protease